MKRYLIIIVFISTYVSAQKSSIEGHIEYIESYNPGTKEKHTLFFNSKGSMYEQEIDKSRKGETINENEDGTFAISYSYHLETPEYVSFDLKSNVSYFRKVLGMELLTVKDSVEQIQWELLKETKNIGTFLCQKAKGAYRGRTYVVWFTNDIPVPFGPWKLSGLSGLILEVSETSGAYSIIATSIKLGEGGQEFENKIKTLNLKDVISLEDYKEILEEEHQATISYINSRLPQGSSLPMPTEEAVRQARQNALEIFESTKN
ncbi:GLPGLI family protein [Maribacter sp. IgM3_T14_3]|uniref:GLPGLI family protein n=1 Tax=Maribacter sp. IgM3_T14_3 TaxID=3415140 RepID=UPI003C6F34FA